MNNNPDNNDITNAGSGTPNSNIDPSGNTTQPSSSNLPADQKVHDLDTIKSESLPAQNVYTPQNIVQEHYNTKPVDTQSQYYIESQEAFFTRFFKGIIRWIFDSIQVIVIALAIFIVFYLFVVSPHTIQGGSMQPNFCNSDFLLADKLTPRFKPYTYGDVIVFKHDESNDYIKRILGMGGDRMRIENGKVYRNGQLVQEAYLQPEVPTEPEIGGPITLGQDYIVPAGHLFVLGDNRPNSKDSRNFGAINPDINTIKGRVILVLSPLSRFRIFNDNAAYPLNECSTK
jgi:signal peptidase I